MIKLKKNITFKHKIYKNNITQQEGNIPHRP